MSVFRQGFLCDHTPFLDVMTCNCGIIMGTDRLDRVYGSFSIEMSLTLYGPC